MYKRITIALSALLAVALAATPALAHEPIDERKLTLQLSEERLDVLLYYKLASQDAAERLVLRHDVDRSGAIDAPREVNALGQILLPVALAHLSFEVKDETPGAREPELKFRRAEDGSLEMMALLSFKLGSLSEDATRRVLVQLKDDPHAIETGVDIQVLAPLHAPLYPPMALAPGETLRYEARREEADEE